MKKSIFFILSLFLYQSVSAQLSIAYSIKNDVVFQQKKPIQLWGWANSNARVDILFNGKTYSTITKKSIYSGEKIAWEISLPPMNTKGPYNIKIQSEGEIIDITNVHIAELIKEEKEIDPTKFSVSELFGNHMVLQRDQPIKIWGTGQKNTLVKIIFDEKHYSTKIDTNNQWFITLPKLTAGGPYNMTITSNEEIITIEDILIGDVWFCTGQSNMGIKVAGSDNGAEEITIANQDKIRHFEILFGYNKYARGEWESTNSNTVKDFTAIGYYYAKELYKTQNIPIGIINSSHGGRRIESWLGIRGTDNFYNSMVYPVQNFSIKGILFYHGESHALKDENDATNYRNQFRKLIKKMRANWNIGNIPFLFIQIAGFKDVNMLAHKNLRAIVRESQTEGLKESNTAQIITIDLDSDQEMHPSNKQDVGIRAALAARRLVYGEDIISSGPRYKCHEIIDDKVIVTFSNVGSGLQVKDQFGNEFGLVKGFTTAIPESDDQFLPTEALIIGKNKVLLKINKINNSHIKIRYAWSNNPNTANLYNSTNLPARPFRTDTLAAINQIVLENKTTAKIKKSKDLFFEKNYMSNVMLSVYITFLCSIIFVLKLFNNID